MTDYRLLTYQTAKGPRAGLLVGETVYDAAELTAHPADATVLAILDDWQNASVRLGRAASCAQPQQGQNLSKVRLRTPILYPNTIYCAGANYKDHAAEMARLFNRKMEPDPHEQGLKCFMFLKAGRTAVDPDATITVTPYSKALDWELELAAVIGRKATAVTEETALDYVAGYTIANDLSARDFARRPHIADASPFKADWASSKNFDHSCPLGPWITPASQIGDPQNLAMKLTINGVTKQESNSGQMIFNIREQIAHLSSRITLYPGDVILTGTPAGVGAARNEFLKAGDVVVLTIERIGALKTTIA